MGYTDRPDRLEHGRNQLESDDMETEPAPALGRRTTASRTDRRPGRRSVSLPLLAAALLVATALPAAAEVVVIVRPDGSKEVRNVGGSAADSRAPSSRSGHSSSRPSTRTVSTTLRPAPERDLERLVDEHAGLNGLDPRLVRAVIQAESGWNHRALSGKGAMGLMQLMPDTAVVLAVDDPWDAAQNVRGGTAYLADLLDRFGSVELALAAYNAGPTAVERYDGIPPYAETREFVRRVLSLWRGRPVSADEVAAGAAAGPVGEIPRFVRGPSGRLTLTTEPAARR
jgi:soluble lytic murein transglycosylase-like protein